MTAPAGTLDRVRSRAALIEVSRADVLAVLAQALLFLPFSALRYIDPDEGDYTLASQLVLDGKLPYADFLHTQMPLLPYVYGVWGAIWGESWYAARALSALFAIALGTLLFRHLRTRFGTAPASVGLYLYVSSSLVFGWLTTVKTQSLATLLLFTAYLALTRERGPRWLASGVLIGLAIDTRLLYAGALPAFAWLAWRGGGLRRLGGGFVLGLAPAFLFLALDARRFWFDNLGVHGARSDSGLVGDFTQKGRAVANLLGLEAPGRSFSQFLLLFLAALAAGVVLRSRTRRVPPALVVAGCLAFASLLPTPTYSQYFVATVPFLIVGAIELLAALRPTGATWRARIAPWALGSALVVYALPGLLDASRYVRQFQDQRIRVVTDVRDLVNAQTRPGDEVLVSWPGYLYGTNAVPVPGTESGFAVHDAAALSAREARRYRLASADDIVRTIEERRTGLVIVRLWHELLPIPGWWSALDRAGYTRVARFGSTDVYRAPER